MTALEDAPEPQPEPQHPEQPRPWQVPSEEWPSLAVAVAHAGHGTHIEVQPGHTEVLAEPLIIDRSIFVEGPLDRSARLLGAEGLVVAGDAVESAVVLRRLEFRLTAAPALLIAGGCTVDKCGVEDTDVGIEVVSRTGSAVQILRSSVRGCRIGVAISGAGLASMAETSIEGCTDAVAVTGLDIHEGWGELPGHLEDIQFVDNSGSNIVLKGWSIHESSGRVRLAPPLETIAVRGWPEEACNVVAPTDHGPVVLHFAGSRVNAALFEDEESIGTDEREAGGSFGGGNALRMQIMSEDSSEALAAEGP